MDYKARQGCQQSLVNPSGGNLEDKIAEKSVDCGGLAYEISERNKDFIRKWAKSNFV